MSPTDWSNLKVVDLRAELSNRGLPTKGVKAELIARLNEDDAAQAEVPEVSDEVRSGEAAVANDDPDTEALMKDTSTENAALEPSPAAGPEAVAAEETQTGAEVKTTTTNQNAPGTETVGETQVVEKPDGLATVVPEETVVDPQTRKRRSSRSRTPPPSAKRVRQEREREAEDREDIVDFDTGDIPESIHDKGANGVGNRHVGEDKVAAQAQVALEKAQDAQELSGEEAYLKRVTIAGSFDGRKPSSQVKDAPLDDSGEKAYLKRVAIAETPEAPLSQTNESRAFNEKDEDVKMEDATLGGLSEGPVTSMQSRQTPEAGEGPSEHHQKETSTDADNLATPSTHQPTSALYIRELMRPLKPEVMEQHVVDLIAPEGSDPDPGLVEEFYIDQIRTHAFVQLASVSAAKRVRAALHNQIWPNESNRKPLWVDFVPPSQVRDWIAEESAGSGAQSKRWEVVYEQKGDGVVAIHKTMGSNSKSFSKPPPTGPAAGPTYPGIEAAPRGPRGKGAGPRLETPNSLLTQAHPRLPYTPLSDDVARRRIDNMRSFYSGNPPSDLGKNYHRYTFESVESFVDRGVEVFIGIRPPHREKEHQERLRREQLGTTGAGSAAESRRDDYRPRPVVTDEDRFPRYGDGRRPDRRGRNRGYRGDRGPRRFQGEDPYRYRPGY